MNHLINFFTAFGFKLMFILLVILTFTFLPINFLINEIEITLSIILVLANLMAYISFRVNGSYIISGITNCLLGTALYFFMIQMNEMATAKFISGPEDHFVLLALILKYGIVLSMLTGAVGGVLLCRRKKRRSLEVLVEEASEVDY
jgi:hypothetical protein